jgi:hypothetical protein
MKLILEIELICIGWYISLIGMYTHDFYCQTAYRIHTSFKLTILKTHKCKINYIKLTLLTHGAAHERLKVAQLVKKFHGIYEI